MSLFKRGEFYWYEFWFQGRRYRRSSGVKNQRSAGDIERAFRTALAKGDVGITERKIVPGFRASMIEFLNWSKQEHAAHPRTYARYRVSSLALLRYYGDTSLDKITPEEVERFKTARAGDFKTARSRNGRRLRETSVREDAVREKKSDAMQAVPTPAYRC